MLLFVLFSAHTLWALPSRDLWIPQTRTLKLDRKRLELQQTFNIDKRDGDTNRPEQTSSVGIAYGLLDSEVLGAEVGLDWREPARTEASEALRFNGRIRLFDLEKKGFAFALGADAVGVKSGVSDVNLVYFVMQNDFSGFLVAEIGAYTGNSRLLVDQNGKEDNQGALVGLWRYLDENRQIKFGLEWMSGLNSFGYIFTGVSFRLKEVIVAAVGYGYSNNRESMRDTALVRLGLEF